MSISTLRLILLLKIDKKYQRNFIQVNSKPVSISRHRINIRINLLPQKAMITVKYCEAARQQEGVNVPNNALGIAGIALNR
jgi:hypothetical protein